MTNDDRRGTAPPTPAATPAAVATPPVDDLGVPEIDTFDMECLAFIQAVTAALAMHAMDLRNNGKKDPEIFSKNPFRVNNVVCSNGAPSIVDLIIKYKSKSTRVVQRCRTPGVWVLKLKCIGPAVLNFISKSGSRGTRHSTWSTDGENYRKCCIAVLRLMSLACKEPNRFPVETAAIYGRERVCVYSPFSPFPPHNRVYINHEAVKLFFQYHPDLDTSGVFNTSASTSDSSDVADADDDDADDDYANDDTSSSLSDPESPALSPTLWTPSTTRTLNSASTASSGLSAAPSNRTRTPVVPANKKVASTPPVVSSNEKVASTPSVVPANKKVASTPPVVPANKKVASTPPVVSSNEKVVSTLPVVSSNEKVASTPPVVPGNEKLASTPPVVTGNEKLTSTPPVVPGNEKLASTPLVVTGNEKLASTPPVMTGNMSATKRHSLPSSPRPSKRHTADLMRVNVPAVAASLPSSVPASQRSPTEQDVDLHTATPRTVVGAEQLGDHQIDHQVDCVDLLQYQMEALTAASQLDVRLQHLALRAASEAFSRRIPLSVFSSSLPLLLQHQNTFGNVSQ